MIISVVSVGEKYVNLSCNEIKRFIDNGHNVFILTDLPERFEYGITYKYEKKIFSFFDKLLFTGKLVEEYKENVLYVDADRLHEVSIKSISLYNNLNSFTFFDCWYYQVEKDVWEKWEKFIDFRLDYFEPFIKYCEKNKININNLYCLWEGVFLFPYSHQTSKIIYDIELVKPVFEYMSITGSIANNIYYGKLGISEGLGMSYVLEKNNLQFNKLSLNDVFTTKLI